MSETTCSLLLQFVKQPLGKEVGVWQDVHFPITYIRRGIDELQGAFLSSKFPYPPSTSYTVEPAVVAPMQSSGISLSAFVCACATFPRLRLLGNLDLVCSIAEFPYAGARPISH